MLIKETSKVYHIGDLYVIPYPTPTCLAIGWIQMEREGLLDIVFHEGVQDVGWFVNEYCKGKPILSLWKRTQDTGDVTKDLTLAGFSWFNWSMKIGSSGLIKCETGYVFFKAFHNRKTTLPLAAMSIEWAFDNLNIHTLFGTTPERNRAACLFLRSLGMYAIGPLLNYTTYPAGGDICGVYLSSMSRERWTEERKRFF